MKLVFSVAAAVAVSACTSSSSGTSGATGSGSSGGQSSSGGSTGSTTGPSPELSFDPNPVVFAQGGAKLQHVFITSASGATVSPTLVFQLIPDAGVLCYPAQESAPPTGGGAIALTCDVPGQISVAANNAGTIVYLQSVLDGNGQPTCGPLYYDCQGYGDCCAGLDCTAHDAGPSRGEVNACDYAWTR